jgi:Response regulators consisting of a CheY-like receiver domain and a winged-helix DNA-binding domain
MNYDCLIVDDEVELVEATCEYFNLCEVRSAYVTSSEDCERFLRDNETKLILLDINLGETSGFELCKRLRQTTDVPILFISARSSDDDVLIALNIGGDDYIRKPYSLSILLAKTKAVLKRYGSGGSSGSAERLSYGNVTIDCQLGRVRVGGTEVKLKALELKLICYLARNRNRVVAKDELFHNVWEDAFTGDGTLNVHIRHLREKLEENPNDPRYIKTVWGTGYILEDNPS